MGLHGTEIFGSTLEPQDSSKGLTTISDVLVEILDRYKASEDIENPDAGFSCARCGEYTSSLRCENCDVQMKCNGEVVSGRISPKIRNSEVLDFGSDFEKGILWQLQSGEGKKPVTVKINHDNPLERGEKIKIYLKDESSDIRVDFDINEYGEITIIKILTKGFGKKTYSSLRLNSSSRIENIYKVTLSRYLDYLVGQNSTS